MENVILTVHLILAVLLTGVVLLQRSEGGGLGMGGGGGAGGVMSGRQAANAMTRLTWIFGIAIFCTSLALTVLAARQATNGSVLDQLGVPENTQPDAPSLPGLPAYAPPPTTGGNPLTPPAPEATPETAVEPQAAPAPAEPAVEAPAAEAPATAAPAVDAPVNGAPADAITPPPAEPQAPPAN